MNPSYQYNQYVSPPIVAPPQTIAQQSLAIWGDAIKNNTVGDLLNPFAGAQKTLTDNLPNFLIGGIGLFMILVGIGAVAAPVAKELI